MAAKLKTKGSPFAPPTSDAYTGLLVISLLALIAGCTFLYLDWSQYSKSKPPLPGAAAAKPPPTGAGAGGGQAGQMGGGQVGQMGARGAMGRMGGSPGSP